MKLLEREAEILKILGELSASGAEFVVVGGYAVSALTRHRYSVDCDIVIPKEELKKVASMLKADGYRKHAVREGFDAKYGGFFASYVKDISGFSVSVDLLVNSLVSRQTSASWSFDYIKKHSVLTRVSSVSDSVECSVPEKELLTAFKIHSGRKADIRDIVMLIERGSTESVIRHVKRGDSKELDKIMDRITESLKDKNLRDSLKGSFSITADLTKIIDSASKYFVELKKELSSEKPKGT
jgi:hypothetical protein